ncbi:MAG: hypothetical protein M0Z77_04480 [Thermoplasmatales archaeon]|nr:hypothetical protein [Thermoplasmatales archaeon]
MSSDDNGIPVSPPDGHSSPGSAASSGHKKHYLKFIVMIVAVVIVAAAAVVVVYPSLTHTPKPPPQPIFAFLPSSTFNSTYGGQGFKAANYTSNASSSQSLSSLYADGMEKVEMWLYSTNSTASIGIVATLATLVMEVNSSSDVSLILANLAHSAFTNSTVMSTGNVSGFQYSLLEVNASSSGGLQANVFLAHDGKFILVMEFAGSTIVKEMTIFSDQISVMLQTV